MTAAEFEKQQCERGGLMFERHLNKYEFAEAYAKHENEALEYELSLLRDFFTWDVDTLKLMKEKNLKITNETAYLQERYLGEFHVSTSIIIKEKALKE